MTMNKDLGYILNSEEWRFVKDLVVENGKDIYDNSLILSFSHTIAYTLLKKTDIIYSLYVSKECYAEVKKNIDELRFESEKKV